MIASDNWVISPTASYNNNTHATDYITCTDGKVFEEVEDMEKLKARLICENTLYQKHLEKKRRKEHLRLNKYKTNYISRIILQKMKSLNSVFCERGGVNSEAKKKS